MDYFEQKTPENEQTQKSSLLPPYSLKIRVYILLFVRETYIYTGNFSFIKVSAYQEENQQRQLLSPETTLITRETHLHKIQPLFITYCWLVAAKNSWGDSDSHIFEF